MNHHITKRPDGKWQVKGEGNQRGELFIHGVDGKIRARESHGNDPYPPRG